MRVKELVGTERLIILAELARIALDNNNTRREAQKSLNCANLDLISIQQDIAVFQRAVNEIGPEEIARQIAVERQGQLTVNLNAHLDAADMLTAFEVARQVLGAVGDQDRADWVLEALDLSEDEAYRVFTRLCSLMNDIRFRSQANLPAQESRSLPKLGGSQ